MARSAQTETRSAAHEQPQPGVEYNHQIQGRLISCSRPADDVDIYTFLHHVAGQTRFYWRDRRSNVTLAGVGVALSLLGWSEGRYRQIHRQAQELFGHALLLEAQDPLAAPRLFGGFAFRQDFVPDRIWAAFHPAHFILPHYQFVRRQEKGWLTLNAFLPPGEEPSALRAKLHEALDARYALLQSMEMSGPEAPPTLGEYQISYPMPYETWAWAIAEAIRYFEADRVRKVVLARVCEARRAQPIDVEAALRNLDRRYPDCFTFLFEPRPHHAFFGATPELLAGVQGDHLQSMALAGSAPRGATTAEDERLAAALLNSSKDRHEHALVVDALRQRLADFTDTLEMPDTPRVMKLNNIQHLHTPVRGRLRHPDGVLPLVEALHPTPALGGWPRQPALDFIAKHEQTPRGWYAAPVGWIDHRLDGVFTVAIRSAVVQRTRAWLYAGAGIVADSQPDREWEETGWKFRPILDALGVDKNERGDACAAR